MTWWRPAPPAPYEVLMHNRYSAAAAVAMREVVEAAVAANPRGVLGGDEAATSTDPQPVSAGPSHVCKCVPPASMCGPGDQCLNRYARICVCVQLPARVFECCCVDCFILRTCLPEPRR